MSLAFVVLLFTTMRDIDGLGVAVVLCWLWLTLAAVGEQLAKGQIVEIPDDR